MAPLLAALIALAPFPPPERPVDVAAARIRSEARALFAPSSPGDAIEQLLRRSPIGLDAVRVRAGSSRERIVYLITVTAPIP